MRFVASWVFRCPYWIYLKTKYPEYDLIPLEAVEKGREAEEEFKKVLRRYRKGYRYQINLRYIADSYIISGRVDFITSDRVYEVKHVKKFRKPTKNWVGQLNLYLAMAGKEEGSIVEFNGEKFREYKLKFSKKLLDESIGFFDSIHSGKYIRDFRQCRFCNYSFICLK